MKYLRFYIAEYRGLIIPFGLIIFSGVMAYTSYPREQSKDCCYIGQAIRSGSVAELKAKHPGEPNILRLLTAEGEEVQLRSNIYYKSGDSVCYEIVHNDSKREPAYLAVNYERCES